MRESIALTTAQACATIGVSWHTFMRWCARLGLDSSTEHPYDKRLRMVRATTVEAIIAAREELAEDTAPHRAVRPVEPLSAPQRHIERSGMTGKRRLPDGWMSYNKWLTAHNINRRAFEQAIGQGRVGGPEHGEWWERPQGPARTAFTPEQHAAASRYAARRWGGRFVACSQCSASSDSL
jgi:hypothetical protein